MLSKNVEYRKSELSALRLFYWKAKILNPNKKEWLLFCYRFAFPEASLTSVCEQLWKKMEERPGSRRSA